MKKSSLIYLLIILVSFGCQPKNLLNKSRLDLDRLLLIDEMIEKAIEKNEIPGAVVLVAKDNKIVYEKAFGMKNPETERNLKQMIYLELHL